VEKYPSKFTIYKAGSRFVKATATDAAIETLDKDEIITVRLEKPASGTAEAVLEFA
jgi:hypothetical protein